jgi:HAD superfamily hydrolase (TIGR01549 family)
MRAVLFDLGGTLFSNRDIPRVCMPVLKEAARRLDVAGGLSRVGPAFLEATRITNADYLGRPFYLHRDLFIDTARRLVELLGLPPSDEFGEWFYAAQREVMIRGMVLRRDCLETLEVLRSRGLLLVLVSNIDDDFLEPMLEHLSLRPRFDHWISSERAGSCKPHSGIFHYALARAGCGPDQAVFVGDSRVHDIQGARAVGLRSVLITEEGGVSHLDDENFRAEPDHVIRALSELPRLVGASDGCAR